MKFKIKANRIIDETNDFIPIAQSKGSNRKTWMNTDESIRYIRSDILLRHKNIMS